MILSVLHLARRTIGLIWIALVALLVTISLFTHLAPLLGREVFIIIGGSMEPSIPTGSLVVTSPTDAMAIVVGDVVTIRADNAVVVTHRVTQVLDLPDGRFFEVKGDANEAVDGGLVPARAIVGTVDLHVPYAGFAKAFLSKPAGLIAALSVLGGLFVAYMLLGLLEPPAPPRPVQERKPLGP